jgi:hypothetical protein
MTQFDSRGDEAADTEQQTSSFDVRHPSDIDLMTAIEGIKSQQRAVLTVGYVLVQKSMDDFFAAGHARPGHGDESY